MQNTVPVPAQMQATRPTCTAFLRGAPIPLQCPTWCRTDHAATDLMFIEDLAHEGEPAALPTPVYGGPDAPVLRARLCWWPFTGDDKGPYLALEASDDGECEEMPAAAALAFADQVVAHANTIRHMATTLQKEVA